MAAQLTRMNGRCPARACQVDLLGEKLLAHAALAQEQHGRIGLRRLAGDLELSP